MSVVAPQLRAISENEEPEVIMLVARSCQNGGYVTPRVAAILKQYGIRVVTRRKRYQLPDEERKSIQESIQCCGKRADHCSLNNCTMAI